MSVKRIRIDISLETGAGLKEAALSGYAYLEAGFLKGSIPCGTGLDDAERTMLTGLTFTGCPIAARCDEPALNPWLQTRGAYKGFRTLQGNSFLVRSEIVSRTRDDMIEMKLRAKIEGDLPPLREVARPFQEAIRYSAPGVLVGAFALEFASDGGAVTAEATTRYHLNGISSAPDVWRNITIESSLPEGALIQVEQIDLFGSYEAAKADLDAKLATYN